MKHSNIIYNPITKRTLIDDSLIKALEIAQARKNKLRRNSETQVKEEKETQKKFEMSESHASKPFSK